MIRAKAVVILINTKYDINSIRNHEAKSHDHGRHEPMMGTTGAAEEAKEYN